MTSLDVPNFGARPDRDVIHMATAHMWQQRSICKLNKVGCVITTADFRQIVAIGYNGPAMSLSDDVCTGNTGECQCIHAEENALLALRHQFSTLCMFSTVFPCFMCCQRIIQAQTIRTVYYGRCYRDMSPGRRVLASLAIEMNQLTMENEQ